MTKRESKTYKIMSDKRVIGREYKPILMVTENVLLLLKNYFKKNV